MGKCHFPPHQCIPASAGRPAADGDTAADHGDCRLLPPGARRPRLVLLRRNRALKPEIQAPPRPERVLSCWKDIANYLHRDVRTVQRWERSRGLPVHRLPGQGKNAVYALPTEIDSWWAGTPARQEKVVVVSLPVSPARRRAFAILVGVALVAALGFVAYDPRNQDFGRQNGQASRRGGICC